jgi:hypothetical protein
LYVDCHALKVSGTTAHAFLNFVREVFPAKDLNATQLSAYDRAGTSDSQHQLKHRARRADNVAMEAGANTNFPSVNDATAAAKVQCYSRVI